MHADVTVGPSLLAVIGNVLEECPVEQGLAWLTLRPDRQGLTALAAWLGHDAAVASLPCPAVRSWPHDLINEHVWHHAPCGTEVSGRPVRAQRPAAQVVPLGSSSTS